MSALKILEHSIPIAKCVTHLSMRAPCGRKLLGIVVPLSFNSSYHSETLSKHLKLISNEEVAVDSNYQVQNLDGSRPLTLMYSWTLATDKNIMKYSRIYLDRDIDVLRIKTLPLDLLYPKTGGQVVASEVLKFLVANPSYGQLLCHGMSVGSYAFAELVIKIIEDEKKCNGVKERFVGQIWDSPVDVHGLPPGLSRALTSNKTIQVSLENLFKLHLKLNYNIATVYYNKCSRFIHDNSIGAPGLFLYSKMDPVSTPEMNQDVFKTWPSKGIPVYTKCFEDSRHCCHLMQHSQEYEEEVLTFLEKIGVLQSSERRVAAAVQ